MTGKMHQLADFGLMKVMDVLTWWHGYRIQSVKQASDWEQHNQLVQKLFYEAGFFDSADTPLIEESAATTCSSFLARYRTEPIGAVTVLQNATQLPLQEFFHVELPARVRRDQVAEVTRFVIERDHRTKHAAVSNALLKAALNYSRHNGIRWWIMCAPSMFLWGFQAYFEDCEVLEQLPLLPQQIAVRQGREAYFHSSRAIRVAVVDLHSIRVTGAAIEMFRRRRLRRTRRQKT